MGCYIQRFTKLYRYNVFNTGQYLNILLPNFKKQTYVYPQLCCYNTTKATNAWKKSSGNKADQQISTENTSTNPRNVTIILHDQDDKLVGYFSKSEADKMARDLNLRLVCVRDVNEPQKMYYKFMSGVQLHEERVKMKQEKKDKQTKKEMKIITIKSKIASHDLTTRMNTITKWLNKNLEVQLIVEGASDREKIADAVQKHILEIGRFKNQSGKVGRTIIHIHPISSEIAEEEIKDDS